MLKRLTITLSIHLCSAGFLAADIVDNDQEYLLGYTEYVDALDQLQICCYKIDENLKSRKHLNLNQSFKFPLRDGRELYMIFDDYGAHTFWYRLFIYENNIGFQTVELDVPPFNDISWYPYVFGYRIFNPTFNAKKQELIAWDFGSNGDLLIRLTYHYSAGPDAGFKLKKLEEDNIYDGLSKYNRQVIY